MTVERFLRILISAIRNQGFSRAAPTSFQCAPGASAGELELVGGQQKALSARRWPVAILSKSGARSNR
jgi:hypothetical protein